MTPIKTHIENLLNNYPSLTGVDTFNALDHILVANGTGMDWDKTGRIYYNYSKPEKPEKDTLTLKKAIPTIFKALETIPKVTEKRDRGQADYPIILYWKFPDEAKDDESKWIAIINEKKEPDSQLDTEHSCILDQLIKPLQFSTLSFNYSPIGRTPENVQPDYAEGILKTLLKVLVTPSEPYHGRDNHAMALTFLFRLKPILAPKCKKYPSDETIYSLMEEEEKRNLLRDCNRHVGNHVLDEEKLSNPEFFEYYRMGTENLSNKQMTLLRRYRQFVTWKETYREVANSKREKSEWLEARKFWKAAKIKGKTLTIDLSQDEEIEVWAKSQKFFKSI